MTASVDGFRLRRSALLAFGLIAVVALYCALFGFRSAGLSAVIVDAETGKPVPDATVVAAWSLDQPGPGHGRAQRVIQRIEARTDRDGAFLLPAWGPRFSLPIWRMAGSSPSLHVLKSGYPVGTLYNYSSAFGGFKCDGSRLAQVSSGIPTHVSADIVASWSGCRIPLQRATEPPDLAANRLGLMRSALCGAAADACGQAVRDFFDAERDRLRTLGATTFAW